MVSTLWFLAQIVLGVGLLWLVLCLIGFACFIVGMARNYEEVHP